MGKVLIFKNADFSENAISAETFYDVVRQGDTATPNYPLAANSWAYNSLPVSKKTTIFAVSITLPYLQKAAPSKERTSKLFVGAYDNSGTVEGVKNIVEIDLTTIANDWIDGIIEDGSTHILTLPTPLVLNVGEYYAVSTGTSNTSYNKAIAYARVSDGSNGYLCFIGSSPTTYGLAVTWYGLEG